LLKIIEKGEKKKQDVVKEFGILTLSTIIKYTGRQFDKLKWKLGGLENSETMRILGYS